MADAVIDLNADLGEGFGRWSLTDDEALLSVVTSANVACGYHAGDPSTMRRVCALAAERGVRIGAQVSYHDLAGFGRRAMDVPPEELADEIAYQIGALQVFARAAGSRVSYVKPHGALYSRVVGDSEQAEAVVAGVLRAGAVCDGPLPVLGLPGTLVPRREPDAVVHDPETVITRAVGIARDSTVEAVGGEPIAVEARSLCVHGDTPGAAQLAWRIRGALASAGVRVEAFT